MRLRKTIIDKIKRAIKDSFGDVNVYLFGSRVDDAKKGGDIDIAIECNLSKEEFRKNKVKFLSYLSTNGFEFPIDVVDYNTKDDLLRAQIVANAEKLF
ncbi:MAG: nucleotidyltransferase domain-containing protein [Campylobacterales bacterium]|nr:nucleotidyltransferase domain-containing protein [Campylobacterales bacterium]